MRRRLASGFRSLITSMCGGKSIHQGPKHLLEYSSEMRVLLIAVIGIQVISIGFARVPASCTAPSHDASLDQVQESTCHLDRRAIFCNASCHRHEIIDFDDVFGRLDVIFPFRGLRLCFCCSCISCKLASSPLQPGGFSINSVISRSNRLRHCPPTLG